MREGGEKNPTTNKSFKKKKKRNLERKKKIRKSIKGGEMLRKIKQKGKIKGAKSENEGKLGKRGENR